jgi:hypothetical protein
MLPRKDAQPAVMEKQQLSRHTHGGPKTCTEKEPVKKAFFSTMLTDNNLYRKRATCQVQTLLQGVDRVRW